ncbi:lipocalin-like domain-containing protein [Flavobacterium pallidum]|nr:lipocalin family protein [Flavobacterium pallidum]
MAIIASVAFSCSSDSDSGPAPTIVGKWNLSKTVSTVAGATDTQPYTDNEVGCDKDYVEFVTGGTLKNIVFFKNAQSICTEDAGEQGTWTQANNALNITGGEFEGTYQVAKLSNSELRITASSTVGGAPVTVTYYFNKAS